VWLKAEIKQSLKGNGQRPDRDGIFRRNSKKIDVAKSQNCFGQRPEYFGETPKELRWPKAGIETSSDTNVKNRTCS